MDLQERRQLDVAARMTRARARARPWRSIIALILAIAGAIAAQSVKLPMTLAHPSGAPTDHVQRTIWICGMAAFVVFGISAVVGLSARTRAGLQPIIGQAHAGVLRYVLLLAGFFAVVTIVLSLYGQSPDKWLLGGAVTGVLIGIAAQQSLANLFAGLVLLFASPFRVGDHVRFRAGALSGEIEGVITDLSLTYVRLETDQGRMLLPNAQALAAAVLLVPDRPTTRPASSAGPANLASPASPAGPASGSRATPPGGDGSEAGESAA
jgi:small-conductance mechanosensitive channel